MARQGARDPAHGVLRDPREGGAGACVFCAALGREDGPENWIVRREPHAFVILNIYPYNAGHVMVVPVRHVQALSDLTEEEGAACFSLVARTVDLLRTALGADAVNVGANIGRSAGGSIEHLHLHAVPRWPGDTNFMPVVADTKVLVATLLDTWTRLRDASAGWAGPPR